MDLQACLLFNIEGMKAQTAAFIKDHNNEINEMVENSLEAHIKPDIILKYIEVEIAHAIKTEVSNRVSIAVQRVISSTPEIEKMIQTSLSDKVFKREYKYKCGR